MEIKRPAHGPGACSLCEYVFYFLPPIVEVVSTKTLSISMSSMQFRHESGSPSSLQDDQNDAQLIMISLDMYVKRHEYFRWTPRTAGLTIFYVIAVPAAFLYMGFATEVSCLSKVACTFASGSHVGGKPRRSERPYETSFRSSSSNDYWTLLT